MPRFQANGALPHALEAVVSPFNDAALVGASSLGLVGWAAPGAGTGICSIEPPDKRKTLSWGTGSVNATSRGNPA